ncbi:hypothetical protein [Streptomyces sp. V3I7]|uniref:hypothetical protein n=1 Tax=Streptomyces sp. V3I7 TaxID=3042278 RepID=UPI00277F448E|nr:hypothetical protein [Streptomyces sp. V3I7]MDQ0992157.1 hypothetical protein [Streptomyces sp. V3I7]
MSQYPLIQPGRIVNVSLLQSMLPLEAYKPGDTSRNNTVTLADDPDLFLILEAQATYRVEAFIHYSASATEQIQIAWNAPAGSSGLRSAWGMAQTVNDSSANGPQGDGRWGIHGFGTARAYGTRSGTNQLLAWETGNIITAGAGTLAVQWAQNVSGANMTRVAAGSYMRAKRIA